MTVLQRSGPASTSHSASTASSGDNDLISTASSALRRLHFKSAGGSRANKSKHQQSQQPVPKVVIMGSSTTSNSSNNTINTSTDSANTVATMVTVTDGDYDSENENKPFSYLDDVLGTAISVDKEDEFFSRSGTHDIHPGPPPPTPLLGACQKEQRFIFVKTEADDHNDDDDDDDDDIDSDYTFTLRKTRATVHRSMADEDNISTSSSPKKSKPKPHVILPRKTVGQNNINHTPPPDLRVDFFSENDSLTPVALMEDSQDFEQKSTLVAGTNESNLEGGDLVVGGVSGASGGERVVLATTSSSVLVKRCGTGGGVSEKTGASSLHGTDISSGSQPIVNTTPNPLSLAGTSSALARHQQSTALVVQQNSVIGSPTVATVLLKNCSVAGVTCAGLGVSGVASGEGKQQGLSKQQQQQREDNMKQLLDVANTLTLQELHDFEMKYGSPHHSRSQSVKTPGSRSNSGRPNYLCLPQQRSRVASMPNTGVEEEYYRLRHFSITGKGVVNRGDSLKSRRSRSNNSVTSSNSSHSTEHLTTVNQAGGAGAGAGAGAGGSSYPGSARTSATTSLASSRESSTSNPGPTPYRVVMLGSAGVGKSSLINQFMTSEYLHAYDTSLDDEFGEKSVSVLLDGEESELTFIDHPCAEMSPENCITTYEPHAYCVVYSIVDRASLRCAEESLQCLWKSDSVSSKAVILVGNKTDLVRSRVVSTDEGKNMATSYDCKFIETSVGINHNVDELLVGILTQIRLKLENPERARDLFRKRSCSRKKNRNKSPMGGAGAAAPTGNKPYRGSRTSTSLKVKGLLGKVWARDSKSKSCENLHVL